MPSVSRVGGSVIVLAIGALTAIIDVGVVLFNDSGFIATGSTH